MLTGGDLLHMREMPDSSMYGSAPFLMNGGNLGSVALGADVFGALQQPGASQKTLWIGDLAPWMDEAFLHSLFGPTKQLVSVKIIRNKATGASEGYAFLEMKTHEAADQVLQAYNGRTIPGTSNMAFRMNWAAYGVGRSSQPTSEDHSLFVGDLAPDVSDLILQEYFRQFYPSVRSAKVITDPTTGRSKGYGFVRFSVETERNIALSEMNGHCLSNRPIRVSLATAKKNAQIPQMQAVQQFHPSDLDPTNTTLFIGGLSSQVVEEQLRAVFGQFGDIIYVKIPQGKGCGFVQYVLRTSAERAMVTMNGKVLGNSAIRISWGRSSSRASNQSITGFLNDNFQQQPHQIVDPSVMMSAGYQAAGPLPSSDLLARSYHLRNMSLGAHGIENIDRDPSSYGYIQDSSRRSSLQTSNDLDALAVDGSNQSNGSGPGSTDSVLVGSAPLGKTIPHDLTPIFANIVA